ncbi:DUF3850 domain-containing protein [Enterococcus faecalis]|uniref:DUF3850 domain-containing protein n=1 Tax=Enterococcus faecalis TaxID=1351 RepID=UPI0017803D69|nr:DUF3850 domain-containing protein [Enterococcus faecalis]MBD9774248.1 DUF3850 domain-containing protein [Enterococcus faecalis]MBD9792253.1 DUF3850 domain-containing protein [Enterococcus faecalis]MBD9797758.1 DUF3850 domain-containing protein [Enterococcus faecalis]
MNKQEKEDLIQALYDIGGCEAEDEWARGYDDGVNTAIEVVKELKVQGKVILPKTADDFIKEGLSMGSDKVDIIGSAVSFSSAMPTAEFSMWFKTNGDLLIDALANGYEVEKEPTIHELKILPEYFEAVVSGDKCFEIRRNDRGYKVGDILRLNEYEDGKYTGNFHVAEITYITDYAQQDGYVVLGIK